MNYGWARTVYKLDVTLGQSIEKYSVLKTVSGKVQNATSTDTKIVYAALENVDNAWANTTIKAVSLANNLVRADVNATPAQEAVGQYLNLADEKTLDYSTLWVAGVFQVVNLVEWENKVEWYFVSALWGDGSIDTSKIVYEL